ncbi:MAG: NADH:ubiquinone reductase (Na(+)-transporting) subunit B [Thermoguttaceae bacterium]
MKFIYSLVEQVGKLFDPKKKGIFSPFYYLFEAFETFLFIKPVKATGTVHVRDAIDYKRMMMCVVYALMPCVIMAMYNTGYQANLVISKLGIGADQIASVIPGWRGPALAWINSVYNFGYDPNNILACLVHGALYFLPMYIVSMVAGGLWEVLFALVRKHEINEGFFVTGLLFPLTLPPATPLWMVAIGISFGVVVGKEVFGGTGRNFLNPALVARAYLFFAHATSMSGNTVWTAVNWTAVKELTAAAKADAISGATPLALGMDPVTGGVKAITAAGYTWFDAFIGRIPGSIGETSTAACLIGMVMLLAFGIASWRIMLSMTLSASAVALLFNFINSETNAAFSVAPHWHIVLGGFALGMVFMATDPVTSAMTKLGQFIYGSLIGAVVLIVRVLNPAYPEGVMLAILLGNLTAPTIDYYIVKANIKRRLRRQQTT